MLGLSHKKLIVWQKSLLLVNEVYLLTDDFPTGEKFGLVSQMRRASVSVVSNIAEGAARRTGKEKRRFYDIARASLVEVDTQIEISLKLGFLESTEIERLSKLLNECFAMLTKLRSLS